MSRTTDFSPAYSDDLSHRLPPGYASVGTLLPLNLGYSDLFVKWQANLLLPLDHFALQSTKQ